MQGQILAEDTLLLYSYSVISVLQTRAIQLVIYPLLAVLNFLLVLSYFTLTMQQATNSNYMCFIESGYNQVSCMCLTVNMHFIARAYGKKQLHYPCSAFGRLLSAFVF